MYTFLRCPLRFNFRIHAVEAKDFGEYRCIAANLLGRDEGSMWLVGE